MDLHLKVILLLNNLFLKLLNHYLIGNYKNNMREGKGIETSPNKYKFEGRNLF